MREAAAAVHAAAMHACWLSLEEMQDMEEVLRSCVVAPAAAAAAEDELHTAAPRLSFTTTLPSSVTCKQGEQGWTAGLRRWI
jgi:hypothetical protein